MAFGFVLLNYRKARVRECELRMRFFGVNDLWPEPQGSGTIYVIAEKPPGNYARRLNGNYMGATLSHGFVGMGRWLRKELISIWPVFLFFLVGFLLLISMIKLALSEFSIEVTVVSNAVIGALLAAKAALVLDETPLARSLDHYRRIIAVAVKVFFYGITCLLLLYFERFLEALHKTHNSGAALEYVVKNAPRSRVLVWALGISIVFALYFAFVEISGRMGEGELWRLFFEPHRNANRSTQPSSMIAGERRN